MLWDEVDAPSKGPGFMWLQALPMHTNFILTEIMQFNSREFNFVFSVQSRYVGSFLSPSKRFDEIAKRGVACSEHGVVDGVGLGH
jgi:hypothetical protein